MAKNFKKKTATTARFIQNIYTVLSKCHRVKIAKLQNISSASYNKAVTKEIYILTNRNLCSILIEFSL